MRNHYFQLVYFSLTVVDELKTICPRPFNTSITGSKVLFCLFTLLLVSCSNFPETDISKDCQPTAFDELGPFYRPGAPVRSKVGSGYLLKGSVLSTNKCAPLPKAKLEFWLVNSQGEYDDAHRATVMANVKGQYTFESNRPTNYVGRLPHIHMIITAQGHEELITQHYPEEGLASADFDIVLSPVSKE